ncbi:PAS domain-containing sensor histidine kinase [Flavivirga rizhaonensis]|uniref:histidine kinase n=1 Tax=Flavivirga rizhaonensis TaxID=2559571 RepID=A0A4S1DTG3_9FLAO|nr:PAS domain-containing sensor histidine kinase [Flavivirga rizhaonensis]TGV00662.1 PAS domain-containing sensor histidine kinase [Flavivirga rizhaonensis]
MSQDQIDMLKRALAREKAARKQAEKILEDKAAELYEAKQKLEKSYLELEALLDKTDSQLQGVFENIVDAYVIIDLQGDILKMNEAAVDMLGFDDAKENFNLMKLAAPKETKRVADSFRSLLEKGSITDFFLNIITRKNESKLVHVNASVIYDKGIPVAAQGIVRDITIAKQNEEQLIESENRLSTLILNLDSGVLLEDENRKIVLTNKKFCELFGIPISPELMVGQDCSNAAEQSKTLFVDAEKFISKINETLKNRKTVLGDELKMLDGKILERDYIPIFKNNIYKGHLWSYRDVTLKRNYHQSLEAQRQKYSNIIANMNLGLVEADNDGKILMINQSFSEMSGYSEEELIGKTGKELFLTEENAEVIETKDVKRHKGESHSYEIKVKNKSNEDRHWLISGAPNYNLNGELVGAIGVHLDITEIKKLELQKEKLLVKLEKSNDELQEYAHIVSHDLKSPLRGIDALVNWIKEDNKGKLDAVSIQNFELIETTLEKMEQLISDILLYSSIGSEAPEKEPVDLNDVVSELKTILFVPEHISINVLNKLPIVKGDKTKLKQLFQNLISNGVKFNDKERGIIEIDVLEQKSFYQFSIKDNGVGIEKEYHDKIFKIFHSLNTSKESTGIGLSIVKKIIDLYKGEIWIDSEAGNGTTFYFTLKK